MKHSFSVFSASRFCSEHSHSGSCLSAASRFLIDLLMDIWSGTDWHSQLYQGVSMPNPHVQGLFTGLSNTLYLETINSCH